MGSTEASKKAVSDLELTRERSRNEVNQFLESERVDHNRGGVPGWKAAFGARHHEELIAVCVLSRPVARELDDGETISISRLAAVPERPANTGSWLIARARRWAELEGFSRMIAYAGVAGNKGTVYAAAGFELDKVDEADGDGWQYREGRDSWEDYTRRRWIYDF